MMCSMGLIAFSLSPFFLEQLVGHARTPEELLQGYSQWYIAVISAVASAILIGAVAVILYWKWGIGVEKGHPPDASHHGLPAAAGRVHAAQ